MIENQAPKNKQKKQIDQLKQIQKLCNQNADIDINHRMTRAMISSLATIIQYHLQNHQKQSKPKQQQEIQVQDIPNNLIPQQNNFHQQIDQVKTIIQRKTLALDNLITNLRIQMKNTFIGWGKNLDSQINLQKLETHNKIQVQAKNMNDRINLIYNQLKDKLVQMMKQINPNSIYDKISFLTENINKVRQQNYIKNQQNIQMIINLRQQFHKGGIKSQQIGNKLQEMKKQVKINNFVDVGRQQKIRAIDWIDTNCACFKNLNIKQNIITNQKQGQVQIFGKPLLNGNAFFSICPIKIKSNFVVGIVDSVRKTQAGWPGQQIKRLLYQNNGNCYYSNQTKCKKTDNRFNAGETVKVQVDFVRGIIQWKVGEIVKQSMQCPNLMNNKVKWAPFVNMDHYGDSFMIEKNK